MPTDDSIGFSNLPSDNQSLAQSARRFVEVARGLSDPHPGRRTEPRSPRSISLRVQLLDEDFHPAGDPFWTVSRDISVRGLGFIIPEPVDHKFLKIGLGENMPMVFSEVRHCTSIGQDYKLYLIGVRFLDDYYE
ncbi:MAG: PilZ domain-containing protein [Planctomycetota bacterium]